VVTHVPPWFSAEEMIAEAVGVYDGEIAAAHTGAVYEI
jgi:hypothetical protein